MVQRDDGYYRIQTTLVHIVIAAIMSALLGIAGYMVIWGLDDRGYKATTEVRLKELELAHKEIDLILQQGILPRADERLTAVERRLERIEADHERYKRELRGKQ